MKNKKTIIVFSILLGLACAWQLSFSLKTRSFEDKARTFASKSKSDKGSAYRRYIDSLGNKPIYDIGIASFTYFECKQREVNLGLDLRGGMNVILEVDKGTIIKGLSNNSDDQDLKKAVAKSDQIMREKGGDYVNIFIQSFKEIAPNRKIANLFVKGNNKSGGIQNNSSESQVNALLRQETEGAIDRVYEVVEKRINQANVTQPTIQKIDGGRISVELPGVDNPKRMEDLVEKSANLEFYEVYGNTQIDNEGSKFLERLLKISANLERPADTSTAKSDSTLAGKEKDSSQVADADTNSAKSSDESSKMASSPLGKLLKPMPQGSYVALIKASDRQKLTNLLENPIYQGEMANAKVAFSAKPAEINQQGKETNSADEYEVYFLKKDRDGKAVLSSDEENIISDARANPGQTGGLEVAMEMTPQAASRWAQITGTNLNKFIAIVLDGRVYSAPVVQSKISGGNSQITGNFDIKEAEDLANVLKAGKLPAPAKIVASEVVGPTLGQESIDRGLNSLMFGFIAVLAFMILYYNRAGWIAIVAVFANVFVIFGVLSNLGAALTLPGIAGVILTVGMAVDANVLIFERIKEELRQGKSQRTALELGFKHAMSAIIDSNLTTLLSGTILMFTGAGPAYGFAVILVIGIFSSLYTSLLITRLLLTKRVDSGKETAFGYKWNRHLLENINFDFVGKRRLFFFVSLPVILVASVLFVMRGGMSTGIDFKGGNSYIIQTQPSAKYGVDDLKVRLDKHLPGSSNEVKTFGSEGKFRVITTYMINSDSKEDREKASHKVLESLQDLKLVIHNDDPNTAILSSNRVGATVATSVRNKSIVLLVLATIGMFLYIIFRFRNVAFASGALIALVHDILFVLAVFVLLDGVVPFPMEFDQNFIAAMLTLVGYSMHDTVIVFDRIREYLTNKHTKADEPGLINAAINQTLNRTIVTSLTVFIVVVTLFLFGGDSLKGFSLTLIVGVIVGTYSSIFIATPVVVEFGSRKDKKELN
ncbi:MAG: protein translocase subunit SecDF [Bacteroidetes bacterium]|nr:protein translocase subunit SecDF [Bacteroidota bacterium]